MIKRITLAAPGRRPRGGQQGDQFIAGTQTQDNGGADSGDHEEWSGSRCVWKVEPTGLLLLEHGHEKTEESRMILGFTLGATGESFHFLKWGECEKRGSLGGEVRTRVVSGHFSLRSFLHFRRDTLDRPSIVCVCSSGKRRRQETSHEVR